MRGHDVAHGRHLFAEGAEGAGAEALHALPLEGEELEACEERGRMDPSDPCTEDEKAGVVTHPLDSLPLIVVNVLMALALQTGWKLYNHSSTNAEMRKVPM